VRTLSSPEVPWLPILMAGEGIRVSVTVRTTLETPRDYRPSDFPPMTVGVFDGTPGNPQGVIASSRGEAGNWIGVAGGSDYGRGPTNSTL
jgi:hypothetical protein